MIVLLNASAGRGRSRKKLQRVEELCRAAGVEVFPAASPQQAEERARDAARTGAGRVIAAGGDGTVHYVLNGIAGTDAALGIIPIGSGNDVARNAGIPLDVNEATRIALSGAARQIDLVQVAGRYFVGVASFGLDSHANRIANQQKWLSGTTLYVYAMLRALLEYELPAVEIESDSGGFRGPMMLLAVGNGPSYGGGMRIVPRAEMNDGQLDVCVVGRMSRLKLLRCFPEVFSGSHLRHREVYYFRARRVLIGASRPLDIFADGEFVGHTPALVELIPNALPMITGPAADFQASQKP